MRNVYLDNNNNNSSNKDDDDNDDYVYDVLKDNRFNNKFVDPGTFAAAAVKRNLIASKHRIRCFGILECIN
jgi:hypothetical protein